MIRRLVMGAFALALALGCAGSGPPSSGQCSGAGSLASVGVDMSPDESWFYAVDDVMLDEDAVVHMIYGDDVLVYAEWDDMPTSADEGVHDLPLNEFDDVLIESWSMTVVAAGDTQPVEGTIELTESKRSRLVGSFTVAYPEGELDCSFDLRRANELDDDEDADDDVFDD